MKKEIMYEPRHPAKTGNNALDWPVASNAKTMEVRSALDAPCKHS